MATQKELDKCYIKMTKTVAQLSKAVRKKVKEKINEQFRKTH